MSTETEVLEIQKKLVKMSSPDGTVSITHKRKRVAPKKTIHIKAQCTICTNQVCVYYQRVIVLNVQKTVRFVVLK